MFSGHEKYQAERTAAKIFIIKCFHPKSCYRGEPKHRFEVQNYPACTNIGFSNSALSREDKIWSLGEKGQGNFHAVTSDSPGSSYLVMQGKLLHRTTTSIDGRIGSKLQSKKKGVFKLHTVAYPDSKNPCLNQECHCCGPIQCNNCCKWISTILCFA